MSPSMFGLERYPVQVRHPERVVQCRLVLVGEEPKVPIEMKLFGPARELVDHVPAADDHKDDARLVPQAPRGVEYRLELVSASEIAGVADDELALETPGPAQGVLGF